MQAARTEENVLKFKIAKETLVPITRRLEIYQRVRLARRCLRKFQTPKEISAENATTKTSEANQN